MNDDVFTDTTVEDTLLVNCLEGFYGWLNNQRVISYTTNCNLYGGASPSIDCDMEIGKHNNPLQVVSRYRDTQLEVGK